LWALGVVYLDSLINEEPLVEQPLIHVLAVFTEVYALALALPVWPYERCDLLDLHLVDDLYYPELPELLGLLLRKR
jgi:hypothetical protein